MPEGDSLRKLANRIEERYVGHRVADAVFRHPRLALLDLSGQVLESADAHGKHLLLRFDSGQTLHVHLLMDGRVRLGWPPGIAEWRRRFEIRFDNGVLVGIDIPLLHWIATDREHVFTGHLGPDLCGRYDHEAALARLSAQSDRPLAAALLDQRVVAGFGNIYAVEVPFICGLSPWAPVTEIEGLDGLLAIGAALIRTNAALGPQNTTGRRLETNDHFVLDAKIRHCRLCGSTVGRLAGAETPWGRRTAWCPSCQAPSHRSVDAPRAARLLELHPARRLLDLSRLALVADTSTPVTPRRPTPSTGRAEPRRQRPRPRR